MIPSSGAEYSYFMVAFGPFSAYMFSWVSTIIIKPSQLAIICLSFAEYVVEAFTYECAPSKDLLKIVGMTTVAVVTLVNCLSVKLATTVRFSSSGHRKSKIEHINFLSSIYIHFKVNLSKTFWLIGGHMMLKSGIVFYFILKFY
jgi:amino acid transporter